MAKKDRYLDYADFATILIAPQVTWDTDARARSSFDLFIAYESISEWVEEFSDVL